MVKTKYWYLKIIKVTKDRIYVELPKDLFKGKKKIPTHFYIKNLKDVKLIF